MHACKGGQQQLLACPEPGGPQEAPDAVVALVAQCGGGAVRSSDCGRCGISHTFLTVMMMVVMIGDDNDNDELMMLVVVIVTVIVMVNFTCACVPCVTPCVPPFVPLVSALLRNVR